MLYKRYTAGILIKNQKYMFSTFCKLLKDLIIAAWIPVPTAKLEYWAIIHTNQELTLLESMSDIISQARLDNNSCFQLSIQGENTVTKIMKFMS